MSLLNRRAACPSVLAPLLHGESFSHSRGLGAAILEELPPLMTHGMRCCVPHPQELLSLATMVSQDWFPEQ